ncbi:MAG: CHAD domain-containing protein [Actinomycetota bacterium]
MISLPRALQAAVDDPLELESIVAVLSARFDVATGSRRLVRRRRLDTFDDRLRAAGLTLEHRLIAVRDRGARDVTEQLVLGRPAGLAPLAVPVADLRWPALADALPLGPVRDAVAPVIGVRALMVGSDERRRMRWLELRNSDGKIVARVEVDEPASPSAPAKPARLTVHGLRGYDDQARRADALLCSLGLRAVDHRDISGSAPEPQMPVTDRAVDARVLLATALNGFLVTMRRNLPGLLDDVDTEFLHDFRVAVRRSRATLKLGRPVLPDVMRSRWEPAFKSLGDLTTPVRDLDVYELDLPVMSRWLVTADPADLDPLAAHLRSRRMVARKALVRSLRSARFGRLVMGWGEELAGLLDSPAQEDREQQPAGGFADQTIARAHRRVARDGALIGAQSPAEDLHGLRKRCKELRYALEVFAPMIDDAARGRAVADLKDLQDVLGRFQDSEVQRRALRGFAEEMMAQGTTAGAMLAMGELIGHLDVEQERARRAFDVAFARFGRRSRLQLMHRPGGGR